MCLLKHQKHKKNQCTHILELTFHNVWYSTVTEYFSVTLKIKLLGAYYIKTSLYKLPHCHAYRVSKNDFKNIKCVVMKIMYTTYTFMCIY